jgi:hypothetical protein
VHEPFRQVRTSDKGIESLLAGASIRYSSMLELGNIFIDRADWRMLYRNLLESAGELLTERLKATQGPICLLCCEKSPEECHRKLIADYVQRKLGWEVEHLVVPD